MTSVPQHKFPYNKSYINIMKIYLRVEIYKNRSQFSI